jgi:tetratricopeptide (TPR) repeat protein
MGMLSTRAALAGAFLAVTAVTAASPEGQETAASEKIARAAQEVAYVNLEKARDLFAEVRASTRPGQPDWERAIFGEATCIWHLLPIERANAEQAAKLFSELIARAPQSSFAPRAMMNLGRILELPEDRDDPIDLPGARVWYQKVLDGWPNDPIAGEATLRIAGTYIQTYDDAQLREGVALLRSWVEAHPRDPLASIMWQYLAETYFFPLNDYQRSLEAYEKVDELGWADQGLQGKYYWRIAQMSERFLKNRDAAIKFYNKIIDETPSSGKLYEAQLGLKRLGAPVHEPAMLLRGGNDPTPAAGNDAR